jgi:hypothetical protein
MKKTALIAPGDSCVRRCCCCTSYSQMANLIADTIETALEYNKGAFARCLVATLGRNCTVE